MKRNNDKTVGIEFLYKLKQGERVLKKEVTGRIIFYVGQIEPLDLFTRELISAFEEMNYETFVYDLKKQEDSLKGLTFFCQKPVDAVITFNTMFYKMELSSGQNAWRELGIKYITILVDHPNNFKDTLLDFSDNEVVLCIDKKHMEYVERFFPNIYTFGFLPHGGKEIEPKVLLPFSERKMDVMYAGRIPNANIGALQIPINVIAKYSSLFDVKDFVVTVCKELFADPTQTIENSVEFVLQRMGVRLEEDELGNMISDFMFLHSYILAYYREKVLACIARSGISLYIYGGGWDTYEWTQLENVYLMGNISPEQVLEEMHNAKIVLSTMAWFKDGSHERIFNGMLAKSLVVSETSKYIQEIFSEVGETQEIMLFDLNMLKELPERIQHMLDCENEAMAIVDRGYEKAKFGHTWKIRAKEIAEELLK